MRARTELICKLVTCSCTTNCRVSMYGAYVTINSVTSPAVYISPTRLQSFLRGYWLTVSRSLAGIVLCWWTASECIVQWHRVLVIFLLSGDSFMMFHLVWLMWPEHVRLLVKTKHGEAAVQSLCATYQTNLSDLFCFLTCFNVSFLDVFLLFFMDFKSIFSFFNCLFLPLWSTLSCLVSKLCCTNKLASPLTARHLKSRQLTRAHLQLCLIPLQSEGHANSPDLTHSALVFARDWYQLGRIYCVTLFFLISLFFFFLFFFGQDVTQPGEGSASNVSVGSK